MKRLVIAVDCDDVLVATTPYFVEAYNKAHGTSITLDQANDDSKDVWGADRDVQAERLDALTKTDEYRTRDLSGVFTSLDLVGWTGSKGEVCSGMNADILIDDNIRHLHDAIKCGLPEGGAILFGDYPWNGEDLSATVGIRRCRNWNEVRTVVNEIANAQ